MEYARKASVRTKSAFRPRTLKCYDMLFRSFVAFCLFANVPLSEISVSVALYYLEFLVENCVSVNMIKITLQQLGRCSLCTTCNMVPGNTQKSVIS